MDYTVLGADVSFWQDDPTTPVNIDFAKMAKGLDFVIIRAGQNTWVDKSFAISWVDAKASGIPRSSYWFYDSRTEPERQAEKYISILDGDLGELPLVADYEDNYGGPYGTPDHLYRFIERLKMLAPGKEIMIYTGYYYWIERFASYKPADRLAKLNYFAQYPLWIAWYNTLAPKIPEPWTSWTFWQYTSSGNGTMYGVESKEIDLNWFQGNKAEFVKRFSLEGSTPEIPNPTIDIDEIVYEIKEKEMTQYSMTPIRSGTRIREEHNTFADVITSYNTNATVFGNEVWQAPADGVEVKKDDKWLRVTHVVVLGVSKPVSGWMAYIHKGEPICNNFKELVDDTGDTTPPPVDEPEFPEEFELTPVGSTKKALYRFVKVIE